MTDEIKGLLEGLRTDWEEFKRTNAERVKLEAKGVVDALIEAKLDRVNAAIDAKQEAVEALTARLQTDVNRLKYAAGPGAVGEDLSPEQREYKRALLQYVRKGHVAGLDDLHLKAMSVGSDPDGGYLVTPDTSGRIVRRIYETSPIRQYASAQTISTDRLEGLRDVDEASGAWVSEAGTRSTSNTPSLGRWEIPVHEVYAMPAATQKLLDDSAIDVEAWLAGKVADKLARLSNTAFVTGTGVGKPRGFASYTTAATADDSRSWGVPEHVASGSSGSWGTDPNGIQKLIDVVAALNPQYLGNAAWYMNRTTLGSLRKLTDASSAGKFVFIPSFQAGQPDLLFGYPVRILADMATYSTASALAVAFGDMKAAYQIVDRVGLRVLRDPFSSKPYVLFYTTARVGGDVVDFNAIKFLKFA